MWHDGHGHEYVCYHSICTSACEMCATKLRRSYTHNHHRLHVLHKTTAKSHLHSFRMSSRLRLQMVISIDESRQKSMRWYAERDREKRVGERRRVGEREREVYNGILQYTVGQQSEYERNASWRLYGTHALDNRESRMARINNDSCDKCEKALNEYEVCCFPVRLQCICLEYSRIALNNCTICSTFTNTAHVV